MTKKELIKGQWFAYAGQVAGGLIIGRVLEVCNADYTDNPQGNTACCWIYSMFSQGESWIVEARKITRLLEFGQIRVGKYTQQWDENYKNLLEQWGGSL